MIEEFFDYFEGKFNNCMQAMSHPTKFAMIELIHEKIDNNRFRCIQQYYVDKVSYRNTIIEVISQDSRLILKNYKNEGLTYLDGCDIIMEKQGSEFIGKNHCNNCLVKWRDKQTRLQTSSTLGHNYYHVVDQGYDINTDEQIWGSYNGPFEFVKTPL